MADSLTEYNLSAMSWQTITETKQANVIQKMYMQLYIHGTCLDLYCNPVISQSGTLDP